VETTLRLHLAEPRAGTEDAEHIVEADIDVPSGDMAIYGPADGPGQEVHISITPGRYRARVSYIPSGPPAAGGNDAEYGDHFIYQVDLWPANKSAPVTVPKQGANPWAG
jgi:hypothetical protein